MSDSHANASHLEEPVHPHIAPWKLYAGIFGALLVLTVITVAVSRVDLGAANLAVAILVATIKASLVVTFFMHLKDDRRFNAILFLGSLLFGGLFLAYTLNDTAYRGRVDSQNGVRIDPKTGAWAHGTSADKAKFGSAPNEKAGPRIPIDPEIIAKAKAEPHH